EVYAKLKSEPIDTAIMEKAKNGFVIPADMDWSDVGSWDAVRELHAKSKEDNVVLGGNVQTIDSAGCFVKAEGKNIALIGVNDLVVIVDGPNLLIVPRALDQRVKEATAKMESSPRGKR